MTPWQLLLGVALVCGAIVPGPCTFDPQRRFDCNLGEPCPENFACALDEFCKSADIACLDGEARCEVPGLDRVGLCVAEEDFASSKTHCGLCFQRCLGEGVCVDGACQGAPAAGECVAARGNFDCADNERCDDGACKEGGRGDGDVLDACDEDEDCAGGLCEDGVCTRPCDFGCPFGFTCDDDAIPGGLCVPGDEEICR